MWKCAWGGGAVALAWVVLLAGTPGPAAGQGDVFDVEALCTKDYQTGLEFLKNQRYIDAKESFTAVVEACPDRFDAHQQLGRVALNLREYAQAIESFEKARTLQPDNIDNLEFLAYAYSASGDMDKAEDLYLEVLEKDTERSGAIQNLAYIYERAGKTASSAMLDMAALALTADSTGVEFPAALARKFLTAKVYPQSYHLYKARFEADPGDLESARILAYFYYKMGLSNEAAELYAFILEKEPDSATSMNERKLLADALKKVGKTAEALVQMEWLLEHEPGNMSNYYNIGNIYADMGNYDKAIEWARKGLAQDGSWGCLWYLIGDVLDKKADALQNAKKFQEAIDTYRQAKTEFEKATTDARCGGNARKQLERHDALIDRAQKLWEKEQTGG